MTRRTTSRAARTGHERAVAVGSSKVRGGWADVQPTADGSGGVLERPAPTPIKKPADTFADTYDHVMKYMAKSDVELMAIVRNFRQVSPDTISHLTDVQAVEQFKAGLRRRLEAVVVQHYRSIGRDDLLVVRAGGPY